MQIDRVLIEKVAKLARLELSEDEKLKFVKDFKDILSAFSELDKVDVKEVKDSFHPVEVRDILREDKVGECLTNEQALSQIKNKKDSFFLGPRTVWLQQQSSNLLMKLKKATLI